MKSTKRLICLLLTLALALAVFAGCNGTEAAEDSASEPQEQEETVEASQEESEEPAAEGGALADGTYEAEASGHNGPVTVSVTVSGGSITAVEVGEHGETDGIADPALERIPAAIVENQSVAVDAIAGATFTSNAIIDGVKDCIIQAGGNPDDFMVEIAQTASGETTSQTTQILVVGGGGSGVTAAVRAAQSGNDVILIEKMPGLGGVTQLNAGTLIATGSRFQREELEEENDSPELAYEDIMRVGKNANDPVLVTMITENAGTIVDWLIDELEIPYDVAATQYPDHSAHRQIGVVGRSPSFIEQMSEKFTDMGGTILTETRATDLIVDEDGAVVGVIATGADGGTIEFTAESVILATGGFGADTEMLPDTLDGYLFYGIDSETGDGYKMATAIGADTINLDMVKVYAQGVETVPTRALAATASSTAATAGNGAIYVSSAGQRIIDETASLGELAEITVEQDDKIMYLVMDDAAWQVYVDKSLEDQLVGSAEDLDKWLDIVNNGHPVLAVGDDLKELAETMGIGGDALLATVEAYNADCESGTDSQFGKESPVAIGEGPYHIVEQKPRFQTTLGGLKANDKLEILDTDGNPIPNLYGAGCVVGGANGRDSMTAMMNSWAVMSGYMAAESAVANIA